MRSSLRWSMVTLLDQHSLTDWDSAMVTSGLLGKCLNGTEEKLQYARCERWRLRGERFISSSVPSKDR